MTKELEAIIENQDISGLKELIEGGLNISEIKLVEVLETIYASQLEIGTDESVKIFKYHNMNESKEAKFLTNSLTWAFWFYDTDLIKYLVEHGADVNQEIIIYDRPHDMFFSSNPLQEAYSHLDEELLEYLVSKGAKIDESFKFDLSFWAAENKADKIFEVNEFLLSSAISDLTTLGSNGETAIKSLSELLNSEHYQVLSDLPNYLERTISEIKLFVKYGENANEGCPINDILSSNYLEAEEIKDLFYLFLDAGMDVNNKDREGNTPLIKIVESSSFHSHVFELLRDPSGKANSFINLRDKLILTLVENGIDINARNNLGMTALMLASYKSEKSTVEQLLKYGADINVKSEVTAFDLSPIDEIKKMINDTRNHTPQKLVKILGNFTIDKPIKFTTHKWDFGELKKEYKDFDGYMAEVKKQFNLFGKKSSGRNNDNDKSELETLSSNLHKKIYTFLLETNPAEDYSWCSKTDINIGWSSLNGLKEWCDSGNDPFDFELPNPFLLDTSTDITTFGEIIELFKQEIEIRRDSNMLTNIFTKIDDNSLGGDFTLTTQKLERQFYTDVEKLTNTLDKIFDGIKKHAKYKMVNVVANEHDDGTIELVITHMGSPSTLSAEDLFIEAEDGDFADIKEGLTNLCDWSVEGSFEGDNFRINYLKSNNVKDIEVLEEKSEGFTHILRFYKR